MERSHLRQDRPPNMLRGFFRKPAQLYMPFLCGGCFLLSTPLADRRWLFDAMPAFGHRDTQPSFRACTANAVSFDARAISRHATMLAAPGIHIYREEEERRRATCKQAATLDFAHISIHFSMLPPYAIHANWPCMTYSSEHFYLQCA